jgi:hypothetical protein
LVFVIVHKHFGFSVLDGAKVIGGMILEFLSYLMVRLLSNGDCTYHLLDIPVCELNRILLKFSLFEPIYLARVKFNGIKVFTLVLFGRFTHLRIGVVYKGLSLFFDRRCHSIVHTCGFSLEINI